ncbi:MAG: helix-turn-helix domain-containing protein [Brevibacterium yomogidense]|uniref:helix-turn-helix domain-containing protein n=1 Tax=Brevibacterium sp. Mu109 TaxID=1255669 RepID=UPI000C60C0A2|nr:helix-turn-helix domain-containing protein [Brevibacterium sp. Mu109]SMX88893.1 PucR C-terminal helix-turn-helix domain-containing protein [Brevibacterium sp. Mu109]
MDESVRSGQRAAAEAFEALATYLPVPPCGSWQNPMMVRKRETDATSAEPWPDVVRDLFEAEPDLLARVIEHVRAVYPTYASVSDDLLARSFRQNIDMCVTAVQGEVNPAEGPLRSYAQIARRRFEAGVPIDDLIRSYRFSIGLIADQLTDLLAEHHGSPQGGVDAYRRIWAVTDVYTAQLAEVYRQHRLQFDTRNHELKMDFIERLRSGTIDEPALTEARLRFHLREGIAYRAFIARLTTEADHDLYALMVMLESQLIGHQGLGVIRGSTIVGVCAQEFTVLPALSISYGHESALEDISASFASAQRVAATSVALASGNHDIAESGWRVSVEPEGPVTRHFEKRFVEPLEASAANAAMILTSVRQVLLHNRSFRAAAAALHCHQNTLRYRIARFEEITGARLGDTETVVSLEWMFEARARSEGTAAADGTAGLDR